MLHTLNKDMLVKLVETIQKDKDKEISRLEELLHRYNYTEQCQMKNCKAFVLYANPENVYVRCKYMVTCSFCNASLCDKHLNDCECENLN